MAAAVSAKALLAVHLAGIQSDIDFHNSMSRLVNTLLRQNPTATDAQFHARLLQMIDDGHPVEAASQAAHARPPSLDSSNSAPLAYHVGIYASAVSCRQGELLAEVAIDLLPFSEAAEDAETVRVDQFAEAVRRRAARRVRAAEEAAANASLSSEMAEEEEEEHPPAGAQAADTSYWAVQAERWAGHNLADYWAAYPAAQADRWGGYDWAEAQGQQPAKRQRT